VSDIPAPLRAPLTNGWARRRPVRMVLDCAIWAVALYVATLLRLDFDVQRLWNFQVELLLPVAAAFQLVAGYWNGLYRGWWVNGSFEEVAALARTTVLTTIGLVVVVLLFRSSQLAPIGAVALAGFVAFVGMGGARYVVRQLLEEHRRSHLQGRTRAILFGAGEGGERTIRAMLYDGDSPYTPVALLDDDPNKRHLNVRGVRVLGDRTAMGAVAERTNAKVLVIAIPTGDGALVRDLTAEAREIGLQVRILPSVRELLGDPAVNLTDLREPTEADLLGRHKVETDLFAVSEYLRGKKVLVTGAGGSIGSELCRQIATFSPGKLYMIDRDESALHAVQLGLEGRALLDSDCLVLLDIRDRERVARLLNEIKPDVVFHAAALKHLPLLEAHPSEALKSNIWGTLSVLDAAAAVGVQRFVNISTDKAAKAASALGYSKRVAEGLTSYFGQTQEGRYLSVRFGNVLGSRGSVLTAFRAQLEAGGPLTVTDANVTRYFMTVEEAVQLVIQAGAIGGDGHAMVLDMGEPVRIYDVAKQLAASRRPEVPIELTGLRHGEKLHEDLFCDHEEPMTSSHELIRYVSVPPLDPDDVRELDAAQDREKTLALLEGLAREIDERSRIEVRLELNGIRSLRLEGEAASR
jgi:FlaA1/EpsC-like NDP-sugar epimerase